jgi:hypothetical protein
MQRRKRDMDAVHNQFGGEAVDVRARKKLKKEVAVR